MDTQTWGDIYFMPTPIGPVAVQPHFVVWDCFSASTPDGAWYNEHHVLRAVYGLYESRSAVDYV